MRIFCFKLCGIVAASLLFAIAQCNVVFGQQSANRPATPGKVAAQPAANAGNTLVGKILYNGRPPQPQKIDFSRANLVDNVGRRWVWYDVEHYSKLGLVDESLIVGEEGGIANVVVWVTGINIPVPPANGPLPPATIRVKDGRFSPRVLPFWIAAPLRVSFEDTTAVTHIEWTPTLGGPHNAVLRSGMHQEFKVDMREWVPRPMQSKFHPWMRAYVLPVEYPFYSVTGTDGRFEIKDLPPGEWEFAIWHERSGWLKTDKIPNGRFTRRIAPGKNDLGELRVEPAVVALPEDARPDPNQAELAREADDLRQLAREVRGAMPAGWQARFTNDMPRNPDNLWMTRSDTPRLIISYENEVSGRSLGAGQPAGGNPFEPKQVWISLQLEPYIAPAEFRAKQMHNEAQNARRLDFELRLNGIRNGGKYGDPKPPHAYEPKNPEESDLVRQYSLLWMRTEPAPLPTHFYRTLAMTIDFPMVELQDKALAAQLEQVSNSVMGIVTSYKGDVR